MESKYPGLPTFSDTGGLEEKIQVQSTPDNSNLQGRSSYRDCLNQITVSKEISKWMGRECNYATKYAGTETEFELE